MGLARHLRKAACSLAGGEIIRTIRLSSGESLRVPVHTRGSVIHASRETWMNWLLPRLLDSDPDPVLLDVGANVGQVLLAVREHRPRTRYVGFEPNARTFAYLQRFMHLNTWPSVAAFPVALSDAFGVRTLGIRKPGFDVVSSLIHELRPPDYFRHGQSVLTLTGDSMAEALDLSTVTLMKVDVEGAELEVLRGFRATLDSLRPFVVFELWPTDRDAEDADPRLERAQALAALLSQAGYRFHRIDETKLGPEQTSFDPRDNPPGLLVNMLAVPDTRALPD